METSTPIRRRRNRAGKPSTALANDADAQPRVLIVSNVRLYREGLQVMLAQAGIQSVVGVTAWLERPAVVGELGADVVLVDASLPDFGSVVRTVHAATPTAKIIAIALAGDDLEVVACAEAGVVAFVGCDASSRDLLSTIEQARRGEFAVSPRLASLLLGRVAELSRQRSVSSAAVAGLTRREQDIVPMIERGLSNKEIARALSIEAATVKNHVHNILDKLRLRRRGEIAFERREGHHLVRAPADGSTGDFGHAPGVAHVGAERRLP